MRPLRLAPLLLTLAAAPALADENQDLNLIPPSVTEPAPPASTP